MEDVIAKALEVTENTPQFLKNILRSKGRKRAQDTWAKAGSLFAAKAPAVCDVSRLHRRADGQASHSTTTHADECKRLAETATVPSNRHALLSAAEMWHKLASDTKPRWSGIKSHLGGLRSDI